MRRVTFARQTKKKKIRIISLDIHMGIYIILQIESVGVSAWISHEVPVVLSLALREQAADQ